MATLILRLITLSFFAVSALILSNIMILCDGRPWLRKKALYIFGDSLFDAGNNNYINTLPVLQANYFPYGETFFHHPTGRYTDGRTIPDFISEYAKLPTFIPPYLQPGINYNYGVNFASGGAGALPETQQGLVIDLKTQLSNFKNVQTKLRNKLGDAEAKVLLSTAVYIFSIGSNDYMVPYITNSSLLQSYSQEEYIGIVIGNLTIVVEEIYNMGGRKFGFLNMGPLGCIPLMRALNPRKIGDCIEEVLALARQHNMALSQALQKLETQLKGFKYSVEDMFTLASERLNNPSRYGFKEGKAGCCGSGPYRGIMSCGGKGAVQDYELCDNPSDYMFFDSVHPTEKACEELAKLFWSGNSNITKPYNLKALYEL